MAEIALPQHLSLKTQVLRFVLTGGFSAIVDFGLYLLLYKGAGLQVDLAKAIGFIAGTLTALSDQPALDLSEPRPAGRGSPR